MTQEKALAILKSGRNVFLTGSAGTGKTYVLNQYIQYLKERKVAVAVTASTGIAATHMNGMTIHAWSGIGVKDVMTSKHLSNLMQKKYMRNKMDEVKVLIVDEISMLHRNQFEMVDEVLQYFKMNNLPFGGVQVVFSGDFFQLPPIGQRAELSGEKFSFMSSSWVNADLNICYLTEQYRQSNNDLNVLLNEIRAGEVSESSLQLVQEKIEESQFNDQEIFPKLFTHNADVDRMNEEKLKQISNPIHQYKGTSKGNKILAETIKNNTLAQELLLLKEGAEVMFVRNNYEKGYFNGTLGTVMDFSDKNFPLVKTKDGKWIEVKTETWQIEDEQGKALASFTQIPLRLAWAITIHKSQGMTLDAASIDLRKTFEKGQGYVALSRLRDLNGLQLYGINPLAMRLDELASKADVRFKELSREIDLQITESELEKGFDSFIVKCDGTTSPKEIKKQSEKIKNKKSSTYEITQELWDSGLNLDEITNKRGLTEDTIIKHLDKLKQKSPDLDLERIRPEKKILDQVQKAYNQLENKKNPSYKAIYVTLEGELTYVQIKKALLFIYE